MLSLDPLKNMNTQDWERKTACNLLCNNSVMFFFSGGDTVLQWIGSCLRTY